MSCTGKCSWHIVAERAIMASRWRSHPDQGSAPGQRPHGLVSHIPLDPTGF